VQIFAVHRRAGFGHLRAEDHAHGGAVVVHGQDDAEVTDHRRNDVALPAVGGNELAAAAQANRRRVDRFLPEGTEAFALERAGAVANLAAGEELFEAVVGGAREDHAAQDFALFLGRKRCRDGLATQKSVAGVDDFSDCVVKAFADADTGRALGNGARQLLRGAGIGREEIGKSLAEDAAEWVAQGVDGGWIALVDRATRDHVERSDSGT